MSRTTDELVSNLFRETPMVPQKPMKSVIDRRYERKSSMLKENNSIDNDIKVKETPNHDIEKPQLDILKSVKPKPMDNKSIRVVKNIGFENLPNQIYRRCLNTGFELNLMVVGCSGLGKSTFVNSLFLSELYGPDFPPTYQRTTQTTLIQSSTVNITENDVRLRLTLIDTPGFGEAVDNSECWRPVVEYIESRFNEHMMAQSRVDRKSHSDNHDSRVHVLLYFLEPTGHRMKPLDIEFLTRIHQLVNVVLVIGKADCLMPEECSEFKKSIWEQVRKEGLNIYEFPEEAAIVSLAGGNSSSSALTNHTLRDVLSKRKRMPFAVVSSNVTIERNGQKIRGRAYPWGVVEVDNLEHNDFTALRALLLSSHLQDLLDTTDRIHYEKYRAEKLSVIAENSKFGIEEGRDPMSQMDEERKRFEEKIKKMREDMQALFDHKVEEKTKRYQEKLTQYERSQQEWTDELNLEVKEIEKLRSTFEAERLLWEEKNRNTALHASVDTLDIKEKKHKSKWLLK